VQKGQSESEIVGLSRRLGVAQTATKALLTILNENEVAEDQLVNKLIEIALRYKSMQERLATLSSSDPDVQPLLDEARAETMVGNFSRAEQLLAQAEQRSLQSLESAERQLLERGRDAVKVRATTAEIQLVKLNYSVALDSLREAARLSAKYAAELEPEYQFRFGTVAVEMEQWADANAAFERALGLVSTNANGDAASQAQFKTWLAHVKGRLNQPAAAEVLFNDALNYYIAQGDIANAARTLNSLSSVVANQGRRQEATKLLQRAILAGTKALGRHHPNVAVWVNNLGNFRAAQDRLSAATRLYKAAIKIDKETLGGDHPQTWRHLANLGSALFVMGKYEEGAPFLEEAFERGRVSFGGSSPITLRRLAMYAIYLLDTKKYEQAERLLRDALAGDVLMAESKRQAAILLQNAYGRLLTEIGRPKEALPYLAGAHTAAQVQFGPENHLTVVIGGNLARVLGDLGQDQEALRRFEEAVQLIEANHLSSSTRVGRVYRYFADFCRKRGCLKRAEQLEAQLPAPTTEAVELELKTSRNAFGNEMLLPPTR
jgi:tetratricopeptide (TPR) repeat protein